MTRDERVTLTPEEHKAVMAARTMTPLTLIMVVETIKAEALRRVSRGARRPDPSLTDADREVIDDMLRQDVLADDPSAVYAAFERVLAAHARLGATR